MWAEPILHVDMDSFFVEVERLDDTSLIGRPVAVGGRGKRGVIAAASYEARTFGVHSAQPTATALKLCPDLTVVSPDHRKYGEISTEVFALFRAVTPLVEGLSLDEAFLDVSGLTRHYPTAVAVGERVRSRIRHELGLPASVGIASTKFVAKLASEDAKPDGLRIVTLDEEAPFLMSLPATSLWGVGPATFAALDRLGVSTVGDIAELPIQSLANAVGPSLGNHLFDLAHGRDPRKVEPDSSSKSISVEETYDRDLEGLVVMETALLSHAQKLSVRLRQAGLVARTVNLKARYEDFTTVTRSRTVEGAVSGSREIFKLGVELLGQIDSSRSVRLLGLSGSNLEAEEEPRQLDMSGSAEWDRVEDAITSIRNRFGTEAVSPARLIKRENEVHE